MRKNVVMLALVGLLVMTFGSMGWSEGFDNLELHVGLMPTYCEGHYSSWDFMGIGIKNSDSQPLLLLELGVPLSTRVGITICPTPLFLDFFVVPYFTYGWESYDTVYGGTVIDDYNEFGVFLTFDYEKFGFHIQLGTGSPSELNIGAGVSFGLLEL